MKGIHMNTYIKELITGKEKARAVEMAALMHTDNLPVLNKFNTHLSELSETIVKSIYSAGGMYLTDIKMMLSFSYEEQTIEKAVKELISDGYIIKSSTPYGILLGLSKEGVSQIKMHPDYYDGSFQVNVQDMDLSGEASYLKRKCCSYAIADYVFNRRLIMLWNKFWSTDKLIRNHYLMKQYIKNILYRVYLDMDKDSRLTFLTDAGLSEKEQALFLDNTSFIVWTAQKFAELIFIKVGFDRIRATDEYRQYIAIIKRDALKTPKFETYYLLKDMLSDDEKKNYIELKILLTWKCNLIALADDKVRNTLSGTKELVEKEKKLDTVNMYLGTLQNKKRSITSKNAFKGKGNEREVAEAVVNLAMLDSAINECKEIKSTLEADFSFAVLRSYDGNENDYEERVLTLLRLKQNCVYLHARSPKELKLYLIQNQEDYFDLLSMHRKLSIAFQLIKRLWPYVSVEVGIYTYSDEQAAFIESVIPTLIKKLLESKETAFFGNILSDVVSIKKASKTIKPRYKYYQTILDEMKGVTDNDEKRSYESPEN